MRQWSGPVGQQSLVEISLALQVGLHSPPSPTLGPTLDSADIRNYRPVSLLSFLSKTLESAVYNQLSYLSENDLLDPNQSGFRNGHSTETAFPHGDWVAGCRQSLVQLVSSHSPQLILCVWHSQPPNPPLHSGWTWHCWLCSNLVHIIPEQNHTSQVTWNGSLSKPCFLETGVPQGSVLGLLLFSLYTRSLGSAITSQGFCYHCYADEIRHFLSLSPSSSNSQVETRISECLADVSAWTAAHHPKLNLSKTELLFIPGKDCPHMDLSSTVEDVMVSPSSVGRNLGIILDDGCDPPSPWPLLASCCVPHPIQGDCAGTSVVERTPDQCQDSGITLHLPQKTQDSFLQTSPWPRIASLPPPPKKLYALVCSYH